MTTISFLIDVNAPNAAKTFDAVKARLDRLDESMRRTRELSVGNASAMATVAKTQIAVDRLRERVTSPMDVTLRGAQTAEARLLALEASADKLNSKLRDVGGSADSAASGGLENLGSSLGKLSNIMMPALIGAGVALSPVIATVGAGLGAFAAAAYATARPVLAAAQAAGGLKANLDTLNPSQQQLGRGLLSLQGDFSRFEKSMQPEVFSAFDSGLSVAKTLLGDVSPVARAAGGALDRVLAALGSDLHDGEWRQFFGWMAQTAGPDVQMLGQTFTDLLNSLPPLLEDLQPVANGLLQVSDAGAKLIGVTASLPDKISKISDSNDSLLSKMTEGMNWLSAHIPDGNKTILQLIEGSGKASSSLKNMGGSAQAAAPQVGTLSGDVAILGASTSTATVQLSAFSDMWNIFVGKSVGDQQAVLSTAQAFTSFTAAMKQSGVRSTSAQSAFLAYIASVGTGLQTLEKNGASVRSVNSYYETSIARLDKLHHLTPEQKKDVQGLTSDYYAWAASTWGLNKSLLGAAGSLEHSFIAQMEAAHHDTPKVNGDVRALADSLLKTGSASSAARGARQQLIRDLEGAGASAKTATGLVSGLQRQISGLHGKNVGISVKVTGSGGEYITSSTGASGHVSVYPVRAAARGWRVSQGTTPTADDVPVLVSRGETIVSAADSVKLAPAFRALGVPGYASGGLVGSAHTLGNYAADYFSAANAQVLASALHMVNASVRSSLEAEPPGGPGALPHGSLGGVPAEIAYAASLLGRHGWAHNQITPLESLWTRESGWNPYAVNPSSGAYGIPQALGHGHPYNLGDAKAQIAWGLDYIAGRYGSPAAAWAHEQAAGWYHSGGMVPGSGNTDSVLAMLTPGEAVIPRHLVPLFAGALKAHGVPGFSTGGLVRPTASQIAAEQHTGESIADAYLSGAVTTLSKIASEQRAAVKAIQKYYSGRPAAWAENVIARQSHQLTGLVNRLSALTSQHNAAVSYQSSVAGSLSGYGALSGLTVDPFQKGGGLASQLAAKLAQLKKFASSITQLKKAGLSNALLRQVIDMGPDDGYTYAQAMLSGGSALIKQLNTTDAAITSTAASTAHTAAVAVYGKAVVDGFKAQQAALEKQMKNLGAVMGREVARWLGVPKSKLPHYGHGGKFAAGQLISVGERGPELAVFGQPGAILSPEQSAALAARGRGGDGPLVGTLNVNHVPGFTTTADIENALTMASRQVRLARR